MEPQPYSPVGLTPRGNERPATRYGEDISRNPAYLEAKTPYLKQDHEQLFAARIAILSSSVFQSPSCYDS